MEEQAVEHADVERIFGDITEHKVAEIIESGLSIAELEKIALLLAGDTDHMREIGHLAPEAQDLLRLLRSDDEQWEVDRG